MMVQAFDTPAFPVDTHIHRLARRWGLSDGSSVERTERDLKKLYPPERMGRNAPAIHILRARVLHRPRVQDSRDNVRICAALRAKK